MNILVVEDEHFARKAMIKKLSSHSAHDIILEAENGVEALRCMEQNDVDVLITDVKMPRMNGIELLNAIEYEQIQKVILSGYAEFEYAKKAITFGVKSYLLKPVDYTELIDVVDGLRADYYEDRIKIGLFRNDGVLTVDKAFNKELANSVLLVLHDESSGETISNGTMINKIENQLKTLHGIDVRVRGFYNPYKKHEHIFILSGLNHQLQLSLYRDVLVPTLTKRQFMAITRIADVEKNISQSYEICRRKLLRRHFTEGQIFTEAVETKESMRLNHIKQKIDYYLSHLDDSNDLNRKRLLMKEVFTSAGNVLDFENSYSYLLDCLVSRREESVNWHLARSLYDFDSLEYLIDYIVTLDDKVEMDIDDKDIVHKVREYMDQHYEEDISLNDLAENIYYISPNYLSRKIKETLGISFKKYLLKIRMEKSKFLLQQGDLSVGDVAGMVGYNSTSYFIKTYKAYYGHTPKLEK